MRFAGTTTTKIGYLKLWSHNLKLLICIALYCLTDTSKLLKKNKKISDNVEIASKILTLQI